MSKRVKWTTHELGFVATYLDQLPAGDDRSLPRKINEAQRAVLASDRWLSNSTLYTLPISPGFAARLASARDMARTMHARGPIAAPAEPATYADLCEPLACGPAPATLAEQIAMLLLPSVRAIVQDELTALAAAMGAQHQTKLKDMLTQYQPARRQRVDVIGLLPAQANVVRTLLADHAELSVRYILSEQANRVDSYAPDIVLCSGFISHSHQSRAKASGSRVHYANGAAASVAEAINKLVN
jgi:hypothetical protein